VTNAERILQALRTHGPLSDGELLDLTGVRPHQQVNQICLGLERSGLLTRQHGPSGRIVNVLVGSTPPQVAPKRRWFASERGAGPEIPRRERPEPVPVASIPEPADRLECADAMFIVQCSSAKASGGQATESGPHITELLPRKLADRLANARAALHASSGMDESRWMPAAQRYTGTQYVSSSSAIRKHASPLVILSGGYGLVLGDEPIGMYDQEFKLSRWPRGLLQDCLLAVCPSLRVNRVRAFCAATTGYGELVRSVPWPKKMDVYLISPDMAGRGGAQVLVPRALGEALAAGLDDRLHIPMVSSDGVAVKGRKLSGH
jgi:hypothetical protein